MPPSMLNDPFSVDRLNVAGDYHPEWDIPTLGKEFTDAFSAAIDEVCRHPQLDPKRKVQAFIGPPGYGKTHLFGRLLHQKGERVFFSFVTAPPGLDGDDKQNRLEGTLRWQLVESLLSSTDSVAPFRIALARLLVPSFAAYLDQLSPGLRAKCAEIRNGLDGEEGYWSVLDFFGHVEAIEPYHQLANAVQLALPNCSGPVVWALVLSASPAGEDARRWLRGEADQMADERLAALRLLDRGGEPLVSPPLIDILLAVAELLRLNKVPFVLCFDQIEDLFKNDRSGFTALTGQLMSWLQRVPNLLLGLGCMADAWKELKGNEGFKSFLDRLTAHTLPLLTGAEAVELVTRRMRSWADYDPAKPPGWPFDRDSVRAYAEKRQPPPRGFIQEICSPLFTKWLTEKRLGTIKLGGDPPPPPSEELFRQEWAKTLQAIQGKRLSAGNIQEAELWEGVREAVHIAKEGAFQADGFAITKLHPQPLKASPSDPRPSMRIDLTANSKTTSVVLAVSQKDGGVAFGNWFSALDSAITNPVLGAVVVWPRANLAVGKTAAAFVKYKRRLENGTIRPFPLDENEATFHQLECLRQITRRAGNDLILHGKVVTKVECRTLIIDSKMLANLKLFEFLFLNWKGVAGAASPQPLSAVPMVPPAPLTKIAGTLAVGPVPVASPPAAPLPTPSPTSTQMIAATPAPEPTWAEAMLKKTSDFLKKRGQMVHPVGVDVGPTFVRLKVELRGDADYGKVRKQSENLKLNLSLEHEPLITTQAGYVSIDIQRPDRQTVLLTPLLPACPPPFKGEPAFPAGVGVSGNAEWLNLSEPESCHLLVAGTTGSGKSEFLKVVLAGLAARLEPTQVQFRLIDPKRVTFNVDPRCPYLGGPVVYDGEEAIPVLEECVEEMERRYRLLQQRGKDHVRQLTGADAVPRWVVVFDEFADLMTDRLTKKQLEPQLKRLGAKARAAGIHLILGTQRPEASVVTPLLRSNLPGRIGLQVASEKESKLFLDEPDAAYLFGKGDLVWKRGGGLTRLQSPFVPKSEFDKYLRVG
jgi:S-DNA-T family DNA segregation ATPase FtsK/SpoIIIE